MLSAQLLQNSAVCSDIPDVLPFKVDLWDHFSYISVAHNILGINSQNKIFHFLLRIYLIMTNFLVYFLSGKASDGESSISLIRLYILYLIITSV